jgi:xanthine dehydrogenase iron-sulfur cluster and FAD-binding subunit A
VPRTAVPLGIDDPVEQARAELKAALAAIEQKANVAKRVYEATDRTVVRARAFSRKNPAAATAAVVAGAVAVGLVVWAAVRLYTR